MTAVRAQAHSLPGEDTASRDGGASAPVPEATSAYRQILKSSALIGGSSLFNVLFGIVRTKVMALLLGPSSFGLMGAFMSIVDLSRTIAQLGVNASGVRQIAQADATGDLARTAATSRTLRRVALGTATAGALAIVAFAPQISQLTFATPQRWTDIAVLAGAVFFGVVAGGQTALIQGLRRIGDLAQLAMIGTFFGTIASLTLVWFLRERGLALSLVAGAAVSAVAGWLYSRRVALPPVRVSLADTREQAVALFKLGTAFMAADLMVQGAAYLVRIVILREQGLAAAGLYQAAWTLGGLYVGFVLQSMATDFYPRLVGTIHDKPAANRLVNQQASVSLLLAGPGVVATLTLAPLVVQLLYSAKFDGAIETLRWICFGMALRTISWPMGYIVVASGRQLFFLGAEFAWTVVNVALTWFFVIRLGTMGAGVAFFLSYVFHAFMLLPMARHLTGFRWAPENVRLGAVYVAACAIVVGASYLLPGVASTGLGIVVCALLTWRSVVRLAHLSMVQPLPRPLAKLMKAGRWPSRPQETC